MTNQGNYSKEKTKVDETQNMLLNSRGWSPGTILLDEYVVEDLLGRGGIGEVFRVRRRSGHVLFAVKTLQDHMLTSERHRHDFLLELRTWIDLPESSHLAACRFFRTIGGRLAIFSDYVEGGSLQQWIMEKKLLKLDQIIDVAIQCAWGLQTAHDNGVIHQDMKPSNVLMTTDGIAKITDFGMARTRKIEGVEDFRELTPDSAVVSSSGMTLAYCSPEQVERKPITGKTDIWSWGVSVLQMFVGPVFWGFGCMARDILDHVRQQNDYAPYPALPESLAAILERCFCDDPEKRWISFEPIITELHKIYQTVRGKAYFRTYGSTTPKKEKASTTENRWVDQYTTWEDPTPLLQTAIQADDSNKCISPKTGQYGSKKSKALADLAKFTDARQIFQRLKTDSPGRYLKAILKALYNEGLILAFLNDFPGSHEAFSKMISLIDKELSQNATHDLMKAKAQALSSRAKLYFDSQEYEKALTYMKRSLDIEQSIVGENQDVRQRIFLGFSTMNLAGALLKTGYKTESYTRFDDAIAIFESIEVPEKSLDRCIWLTSAYSGKAAAARVLGQMDIARSLYEKSIEMLSSLMETNPSKPALNELCKVHINSTVFHLNTGDMNAALQHAEAAIQILEKGIQDMGFARQNDRMILLYRYKGMALNSLQRLEEALTAHAISVGIAEKLYDKEGRTDLVSELTTSYNALATTLFDMGRIARAWNILDKSESLLSAQYYQENRKNFAVELILTLQFKARCQQHSGEFVRALELCRRIDEIVELTPEIATHQHYDYIQFMNRGLQADLFQSIGKKLEADEILTHLIPDLEAAIARSYQKDLAELLKKLQSIRQIQRD